MIEEENIPKIPEETFEEVRDHTETIREELAHIERLSESCQIPALERNTTQLRSVLRTMELHLPPRLEDSEE